MVGSPALSPVRSALCARRKRGNNRVRHHSPESRSMGDPLGQKGSWRPCFCLLRRLAGRGQPSVGCAVIGVAVLWDKVGGGLRLSKAVADNLGRYTQALLEVARSSGQRSERERLLREDTAALLHRWAANVAPHTLAPEQTPAITEYGGTTFRSQLEARWAAYFDRQGIAWEYEPAQFNGWTPDFRLALGGAPAYAEVKPVDEFPMDVAQRMLNAGCGGNVLILGRGPRHAWRYDGDGWSAVDLTT